MAKYSLEEYEMRSVHSSLLSIAVCVTTVFVSGAADARTIPAAAGMPAASVVGQSDFTWLTNAGLTAPNATATSPRAWIIALPIDTAGLKFFVVKGIPHSSLTCLLEQRGVVARSVAIPVTSVGINPLPVALDVNAGDTVMIRCTFTSSNGRLLLVDYVP